MRAQPVEEEPAHVAAQMKRDSADAGRTGGHVDVAQQQRRLREDRARVARIPERLPDAGHELVARLDPLIRIGVRPGHFQT